MWDAMGSGERRFEGQGSFDWALKRLAQDEQQEKQAIFRNVGCNGKRGRGC